MKAVVFVDVQNDFVKGGKLGFGYPEADNLPKIVEFANECVNSNDCKIYATRDTHSKSYLSSTLEGKNLPMQHCIEETEGWMVADSLMDVVLGHATFIDKPTFGSYDLVEVLEEDFGKDGPDEIIICGYDLSICVLANAVLLRAKFPDKKIMVKLSLCGDVDKEAFDAAAKTLSMQMVETI